jgi:hypothetical protein
MGPLAEADPDLGRVSVRLPNPLGSARLHLVLSGSLSPAVERLALLHEIGHIVHHLDLFLSLGALYQRIALDPPLEVRIGRFLRQHGKRLVSLREREADLFAVSWLIPCRLDADDAAPLLPSMEGLSVDATRYVLLRRHFGAEMTASPGHLDREILETRAAEEKRRAAESEYPVGRSLYLRLSWVLFNRIKIRAEGRSEVASLQREYFRVAGYPPRHLRELRVPRPRGSDLTDEQRSFQWIRRIKPDQVAREVDGVQWGPLMVDFAGDRSAGYHIPIRPVPSRNPRDSEVEWQHLFDAPLGVPRRLDDWMRRGSEQGAGLLLFSRSPAERMLDTGHYERQGTG